MRFRRLIAAFLTVFTLHLNLLGADFACGKHGFEGGDDAHATAMAMPTDGEGHDHEQMMASMQHESKPELEVAVSGGHQPCDIPVQPNCCKAVTSCNVVFEAGSELEVASAPPAQRTIALGAMNTPLSERAAPEPPPPKV